MPAVHNLITGAHINIHAYPNPIDVRYTTVRKLIPKLIFHDDGSPHILANESGPSEPHQNLCNITTPTTVHNKYDIVLHLGVASSRDYYTLETCAHRDGYDRPDVDGQSFEKDTFWRDMCNAPEVLRPTFDTTDVWRRWKSELMDQDLRPSHDAGHYLCDFTYFASMLEYWRRDKDGKRPCMFLHVPDGHEEEDLERGRRVALGLITALVSSELQRKQKEEVEQNGS